MALQIGYKLDQSHHPLASCPITNCVCYARVESVYEIDDMWRRSGIKLEIRLTVCRPGAKYHRSTTRSEAPGVEGPETSIRLEWANMQVVQLIEGVPELAGSSCVAVSRHLEPYWLSWTSQR